MSLGLKLSWFQNYINYLINQSNHIQIMSQQIPSVNREPQEEQMEQEEGNLEQENAIVLEQPSQQQENINSEHQNQEEPALQQQQPQQMDEQHPSQQRNSNSQKVQQQEQLQVQEKQADQVQAKQASSQQKNHNSKQKKLQQDQKAVQQPNKGEPKSSNPKQQKPTEKQRAQNEKKQSQSAKALLSKKQSMETESYINKLEKKMQQINQKYQVCRLNLTQREAELEKSYKKVAQVVEQSQSKEKKVRRYERMQDLEKRNMEKLKREVNRLNNEIRQYQQIGDITMLKSRIQELEALTTSQKQQITILNDTIKFLNQNNDQSDNELTLQKVNVLKVLQNQNDSLRAEVQRLEFELKEKHSQNKEIETIIEELNQQNAVRVQELQDKLNFEMKLIDQLKDIHKNEVEKLKNQLGNRKVQIVHKSVDQQAVSAFLRDEKDVLMKQYLTLQLEHLKLKEAYKDIKEKYFSSVRQSKILSSMTVSKRQYEVLLQRYKKCKDCLQRNIKDLKIVKEQLQNLKYKKAQHDDSQVSEQQMINEDQVFGNQQRKASTFQRQEQKQIADFHKTIKKHYHSYAQFIPKHLQTKQSVQIIDMQNRLREKQLACRRCQQELKQVNKLCRIYQSQISFQKDLVNDLKDKIERIDRRKVSQIDQEDLRILQNGNQMMTSNLKVFQIQNLMLVNQNLRIRQQNEKWKDLYQKVKLNFQNILEQKKSLQQRIQVQGQRVNLVERMEMQEKQQIQNEQKEVQKKGKQNVQPKSQVECQTDPISQMYYKQIKELLLILKRFPQKTQEILSNLQKAKELITLNSHRYEKQTQKLNLKFAEVKKQKSENEKWRQTARQQIKDEFQDVRELIQNDRLIKVLKYAKSLIIQFEKQENKGNEDQQMGEEGQSNEQAQNDQKQNVSNQQGMEAQRKEQIQKQGDQKQ